MKSVQLCSVVALALFALPSVSKAMDICSKNENESTYIKTTLLSGDRVRYEHCLIAAPDQCTSIGQKHSYVVSDVIAHSEEEWNDFSRKVGAGALGVAFAGAAGAAGGGFLLSESLPGLVTISGAPVGAGWAFVGGGALVGSWVATKLIGAVNAINPLEDLNNARVLSPEAISGKLENGSCRTLKASTRENVARLAALLDQLPGDAIASRTSKFSNTYGASSALGANSRSAASAH